MVDGADRRRVPAVELVDVSQSAAKAMKASSLLLVLAGCDRLFGFDTVLAPEIVAPTGGCLISGSHDDDVDCVPDMVDKCPGLPDPAQGEQDGDLVGDACDPDPLQGGNKLLVFVPNTDPLTLRGWNTSGAWSIATAALSNADVMNGTANATPARFSMSPSVSTCITGWTSTGWICCWSQ